MSERKLSRRALLRAGASGLAALPTVPALLPSMGFAAEAVPVSADQAGLIRQIRELKTKVDRLVSVEMGLETPKGHLGHRKYRRARHAAHRAEAELDRLTMEALRRPVKTWGDVAVRAELASAHAERSLHGGFALIDDNLPLDRRSNLSDYAMGALMQAALAMGGVHV
jgi:hypothetical protein